MRSLLSKLTAGGLSAGVVLLWWPMVFPSDTVESWLMRGVAWTLLFEFLVLTVSPLEKDLWNTTPARRVAGKAEAARARIDGASPRRRLGARSAIAILALAAPLTLLGVGLNEHLPRLSKPEPEKVEVTKVVRVVERAPARKVVRDQSHLLSATPAPSASSSHTPSSRASARRGPARRHQQRRRAAPRREAPRSESRPPADPVEPEPTGCDSGSGCEPAEPLPPA